MLSACFVDLHNLDTPEKSDSTGLNCQSLHEVNELPHLHHQKIWLTQLPLLESLLINKAVKKYCMYSWVADINDGGF